MFPSPLKSAADNLKHQTDSCLTGSHVMKLEITGSVQLPHRQGNLINQAVMKSLGRIWVLSYEQY